MSPAVQTRDAEDLRTSVLQALGANSAECAELLAYNANVFQLDRAPRLPLADERMVPVWEEYAEECHRAGSIEPLRRHLPQLRFPIEEGIGQSADYRAAVLRGADIHGTGLALSAPDQCSLLLHPTPAGRIPILIAGVREDFVALLRALTCRNEPRPIPDSMGAVMVAGYNNWDRIRRGNLTSEQLETRKDLYQDRFILLSRGPYSGVPAAAMNMDEPEWLAQSLIIRREHECAHYFTRRVFASMRNNLIDELIADYCGIVAARGSFAANWFLRFIDNGRLAIYRGKPPLSDGAFSILRTLVAAAAANVEAFEGSRRQVQGPAAAILTLAGMTLEELASREALRELTAGFDRRLEELCEKPCT